MGGTTPSGPFFDFCLFDFSFETTPYQVTTTRQVYNLLDFIGDISGVGDLFLLVLGIFVVPVNDHNYILEAIEEMYKVKSSD